MVLKSMKINTEQKKIDGIEFKNSAGPNYFPYHHYKPSDDGEFKGQQAQFSKLRSLLVFSPKLSLRLQLPSFQLRGERFMLNWGFKLACAWAKQKHIARTDTLSASVAFNVLFG